MGSMVSLTRATRSVPWIHELSISVLVTHTRTRVPFSSKVVFGFGFQFFVFLICWDITIEVIHAASGSKWHLVEPWSRPFAQWTSPWHLQNRPYPLFFKYAVPFRFYTVRREGETWGRGGARDINAIRIYTRTHIQNPCLLLGFIYSAGTIDMDLLKWFDTVSL